MHMKMCIHFSNRKLLKGLASYKVSLYLILCVRVNSKHIWLLIFDWISLIVWQKFLMNQDWEIFDESGLGKF